MSKTRNSNVITCGICGEQFFLKLNEDYYRREREKEWRIHLDLYHSKKSKDLNKWIK